MSRKSNSIRECFRESAARVICEVAHNESFRVIVLSSHGHAGIARMFIGSVAENVVQEARCPVLVVKPKRNADGGFDSGPLKLKLEELLVGYDHRNGSKRALTVACVIARRAKVKITLVHALEPTTVAPAAKNPSQFEEASAWLAKIVAAHASSAREWGIKVEEGYPSSWDIMSTRDGGTVLSEAPHNAWSALRPARSWR